MAHSISLENGGLVFFFTHIAIKRLLADLGQALNDLIDMLKCSDSPMQQIISLGPNLTQHEHVCTFRLSDFLPMYWNLFLAHLHAFLLHVSKL